MRSIRVDRAPLRLDFASEQATPTHAAARLNDNGYLIVDAFLARDGLLTYSDGATSWNEHRPSEELARASASWAGSVITDEHPPVMLDAKNTAQFDRGHVLGSPTLEIVDGVTYLRGTLMVTDQALIDKMTSGQRELSIGFFANVDVRPGLHNGEKFDAVQTAMIGNHVASVAKGRAGPACRVFLDSKSAPVHNDVRAVCVTANDSPKVVTMLQPALTKTTKTDEAGMPVTTSNLVMPDGTSIEVPTALAAIVEEWLELKKTEGRAVAAAEAPPEAPQDAPADDALPPPEDGEEEEPMDQKPLVGDSADATVDTAAAIKRRVRLERLAAQAGVPESKIDACDDDDLSREVASAVLPAYAGMAKTAKGDALELLVSQAQVELSTRRAAPVNPWERAAPVRKDSEIDPVDQAQIEYLRASGVEV